MRLSFVLLLGLIAQSLSLASLEWVVNPATGHEYARWDQQGNWEEAYDAIAVVDPSAYLVSITSAAEEDWITQTFGWDYFWIGFTDSEKYGGSEHNTGWPGAADPTDPDGPGWVWVCGEPANYTNWDTVDYWGNTWDNPNDGFSGGGGEDFATLHWWGGTGWNDAGNLTWNDTTTYDALFERPAVPEAVPLALLAGVLPFEFVRRWRAKRGRNTSPRT